MNRKLKKIENFYDKYVCRRSLHSLEQLTVAVSIIGFIVNLLWVFLNRTLETPPELIAQAGTSYFSTIFTPFSIILYFEVFLLILSIPQTITRSLARQYQIITLIIILRVFKDVSELETLTDITLDSMILRDILLDTFAGLALFGLVSIFYMTIRGKKIDRDLPENGNPETLLTYKALKKLITLGLVSVLGVLAIIFTFQWLNGLFTGVYVNAFDLQENFLNALFTIMIFTDILLVLLSYFFADDYSIIFRNAAFIISAVFIRFSLTTERPVDVLFAIIAIVIGILTNLLYRFFSLNRGLLLRAKGGDVDIMTEV